MNEENFIIESKPLEVASYKNYKEATFLISVLDQPDLYGRIIPSDAGEKYCTTMIGYPIVAKLKKNIFGQVSDFGGHEQVEIKLSNGKKKKKFLTHAIGSVIDAWVEEREVDGYEDEQKCILIKAKLWTSRFPEYFKVFDKLWEQGKIQSSWELSPIKVITKGANKIYKTFEFIGNAVLGSNKTGAVPGAGVVEYAEYEDDFDIELADALEKDIADFDIENEKEMEEVNLAEKTKKTVSTEDTSVTESNIPNTAESVVEQENKNPESASVDENTATGEVSEEVASLTDCDLFRLISEACRKAISCEWGYVSYWFPEEHTVWFKPCNSPTLLDYKLFTYEVENDDVTVSEPQDVKLTVSVTEVNDVVAEKDEKIGALTAELELKDEAVIKAGEKINKLNIEVSELKPYKEQVETAERERIEAEIAEEKESLKANLLKGDLFTEDEIAKAEIAELIEARDVAAIKGLIAERYIASFDKDEADVAEHENTDIESTSTASLETDDVDESPSAFMKSLLTRK